MRHSLKLILPLGAAIASCASPLPPAWAQTAGMADAARTPGYPPGPRQMRRMMRMQQMGGMVPPAGMPPPRLRAPLMPGAGGTAQSDGLRDGAQTGEAREEKGGAGKPGADDDKKCQGKVRGDAPCLSWTDPRRPPRAVLVCVHGLGLHCGSWEQFGKRMAPLGYTTYAIDVRGFGSWMQASGHEEVNFDACLEDVRTTLLAVRKANPGLPVVLVGESMGGAIALQAAALYPDLVDGLISSVPAGERFQQRKTDLKVALHMLAGFNRPFDIGSQVIDQATEDPNLKAEWKDDPLGRLKLSPKELLQFQSFMNKNHERAPEITKIPVLIVQGSQDKLVKPEGTVELFNELGTDRKDLELVADGEHLILEEGRFSEETLKTVVGWLGAELPEPSPASRGAAGPHIAQARAHFVNGQVPLALQSLQEAVKAQPDSSEAHFLLGMAELRAGHMQPAREHLTKAVRFGRGTPQARKANQLLMTMPREFLAPAMGPQTRAFAQGLKRFRPQAAPGSRGRQEPGGAGPATVLIFNAKWCEPCKDMADVVAEAKKRFGDRVRFIEIDVDDPANEKLVEQYSVSPVPTVVFLRPDGQVADYSIGYSGIDGWVKGMKKVLSPV